MKKFITKFLIYSFILLLIFNIIAFLSLYFLNQSNFYKPQYVKNNILNKQYDYVIIGASNGLTTLNTNKIDSLISTNGFNLCVDDTALSSQYLMLKHFYELNNKTDYCILSILGGLDNQMSRLDLFNRLKSIGYQCPNIIHPKAIVEPSVLLGEGNHIMGGALVGSCALLSNNIIVNSNSVISHDCIIHDNVHVTPGAILAGTVEVGENTIIGMGVTVFYNCKIGNNVIITNGKHIFNNIDDNKIIK